MITTVPQPANGGEDIDRSSIQLSSASPQNANTQRATILRLLFEARSAWVPSPEIAASAQQNNARLYELRKLGFCIKNRTETDKDTGERRSWLRLVRRVREERAQAMPLFAGTVRP